MQITEVTQWGQPRTSTPSEFQDGQDVEIGCQLDVAQNFWMAKLNLEAGQVVGF